MPKALKIVAKVAFGIAVGIATGGAALSVLPTLVGAIGEIGALLTLSLVADAAGIVAGLGFLKKPKLSKIGSQEGVKEEIRSPVAPRQILYGQTISAGVLIYAQRTGAGTKADPYAVHMVYVVAGHAITSFDTFYLNGEAVTLDGSGNVTSGDFAGNVRILTRDGTHTAALSQLVGETDFTSNHKGLGLAYYYVKFTDNLGAKGETAFPNGRPRVTVKTKGAKLYDPRLDSTVGGSGAHRVNDEATWAYSNNPALVAYDYIRRDPLGGRIANNWINVASVQAAANICDEAVALDAGGTQKRYEADGVVFVNRPREDILTDVLSAMAGEIVFQAGQFHLYAGADTAATVTFDESDLRGPLRVATKKPRRQSFTRATGQFIDKQNDLYEATNYPPIIDGTAEVAEGEVLELNIDFPFTTDGARAQRLAKIALKAAQESVSVSMPVKLKGLQVQAWSVVQVTNSRFAWTNKKFRVLGWSLSPDGGVNLELVSYDPSIYAWNEVTEEQAVKTPIQPVLGEDSSTSDKLAGVEDGADVTSNHTANDTANVGGRTASEVNSDLTQALADAATAQSTADGKITSFYQTSAPTADGVGDIWFDTDDNNHAYRWSGSVWVDAQDQGVPQAISSAATAQATADGKIATFFAASGSPPTAEGVGDLWFQTDTQELRRWDGVDWNDKVSDVTSAHTANDTANVGGRTAGQVNADLTQALGDAATAQSTADGKIESFIQTAPPVASGVGDIWFDSDDDNHAYRWSGSAWVDAQDQGVPLAIASAATAQATADGKVTTFFAASGSLPTAEGVGDLWFQTDTQELRRWDGANWNDKVSDVTSSHTSNDTSNVNGKPASDVQQETDDHLADRQRATLSLAATDDNIWIRVYENTVSAGRGSFDLEIIGTGGGLIPGVVRLVVNLNWSNRADITMVNGSGSDIVQEIRVYRDSANTKKYIDVRIGNVSAATTMSVQFIPRGVGFSLSGVTLPMIKNPTIGGTDENLLTATGLGNAAFATLNRDGVANVLKVGAIDLNGLSALDAAGASRNVQAMVTLPGSTMLSQPDGQQARVLQRGPLYANGFDGDVFSFSPAFDSPPQFELLSPGGTEEDSGALTGRISRDTYMDGINGSGGTLRSRLKELVGTPTVVQERTNFGGGHANPEFRGDKTDASPAVDSIFTYLLTVSAGPGPDNDMDGFPDFFSTVTVDFEMFVGGAWVVKDSVGYSTGGSKTRDISKTSFGVTGTVFGLDVASSTNGGDIVSFDGVDFNKATAPGEETATPAGTAPIRFKVILGSEGGIS